MMSSSRSSAAKLSLFVVIGLIVLKVVVAAVTGSISVLAQALDSFLDFVAIAIVLFAVGLAAKPADEEHPFGHGKAEDIAAAVQALLILSAGGLVIYSAILRLISGAAVELTEAGIGVMLLSIIASLVLSRHLRRVSRATDSIALEAYARNIAADVYSAAGVLAGLIVIRFTGLSFFDPIIALAVAIVILREAYIVMRKSFGGLIDIKLPEAEEEVIRACIVEHSRDLVAFHELRTRKSGNQRYIDLHLVMPKNSSVEEAHRMCDHLEEDIESRLHDTNITIHVEPCTLECKHCAVICDLSERKL